VKQGEASTHHPRRGRSSRPSVRRAVSVGALLAQWAGMPIRNRLLLASCFAVLTACSPSPLTVSPDAGGDSLDADRPPGDLTVAATPDLAQGDSTVAATPDLTSNTVVDLAVAGAVDFGPCVPSHIIYTWPNSPAPPGALCDGIVFCVPSSELSAAMAAAPDAVCQPTGNADLGPNDLRCCSWPSSYLTPSVYAQACAVTVLPGGASVSCATE
jgi:hypothetical protein